MLKFGSIQSKCSFWLLCAALCFSMQARADVSVAGVKYPEQITLANAALKLNGAGVRTKAIFKVYTAGLYLPNKALTPELALSMQGAKAMRMTMLRDIDANELGGLLIRSIQANTTREEFLKFAMAFQKISDAFVKTKKLNTGDVFGFDYVPGTGTMMMLNGNVASELGKEPEIMQGMLKIWLGPNPADAELKQALLGGAPKATPSQTESRF